MTSKLSTMTLPTADRNKHVQGSFRLQTSIQSDGLEVVVVKDEEARVATATVQTESVLPKTLNLPGIRSQTVKVLQPPQPPGNAQRQMLRKFEGVVVQRTEKTFIGRFTSTNQPHSTLEAEIALDDLSEADQPLAIEGASLVWTICYCTENGTRTRESMICVRRLPGVSEFELNQASERVNQLVDAIVWG